MNPLRTYWLVGVFATLPCVEPISEAQAQAPVNPVTFIPGFNENQSAFDFMAPTLAQTLNITPFRPALSTGVSIPAQAGQLQSFMVSNNIQAGAPVSIGHSNGGLVTRELHRTFPLLGMIAFGTPNKGVPLLTVVPQAESWVGATIDALNDAVLVSLGLAFHCYWYDDWCYVALAAANLAMDAGIVPALIHNFVVDVLLPGPELLPNDLPESAYLTDLNGAANLAAEATALRANFVITTMSASRGAFVRILEHPTTADNVSDYVEIAAWTVFGTAAYVLSAANDYYNDYYWCWDCEEPFDWSKYYALLATADALYNAWFYLHQWEVFWCGPVNGLDTCTESHDTFIPADDQNWPGAVNIPIQSYWGHRNQALDLLVVDPVRERLALMLGQP